MSRRHSYRSLVHYFGAQKREHCGYCKNGTMSSHALWAELLEPSHYQEMLDRGWRRSGKYCYKPINSITCCPSYTISCDALNFKPDRSQRRCIRNMNNFLQHGIIPRVSCKKRNSNLNDSLGSTSTTSIDSSIRHDKASSRQAAVHKTSVKSNLSGRENQSETVKTLEYLANSSKMKSKRLFRRILRIAEVKKISKEEAYNIILGKSLKRQERFAQKSLEDHLYQKISSEKVSHTLELRIHSVTSDDCNKSRNSELSLLQKYQLSIHRDDEDSWSMKRYNAFLTSSPLIRTNIPTNTSNTFQVSVRDNSTLLKKPQLPSEFGSYHCQYWLDETKLIAVGVLDILTSCITSVYLYYDPEYSFLNLGVYSALHEISMVRCINGISGNISKYYMGFYIHTCPKMSYKIKYQPSSILCPESNVFVDSSICIEKLRMSKYARFSPDYIQSDYKRPTLNDLNRVIILDGGSLLTIGKFIEILSELNISVDRLIEAVLEYSQLVGCRLSSRMILGSHTLRQQYLSDATNVD